MLPAKITLASRHVINAESKTVFEQQVWHASYQEYLLKSQAYNPEGKFKTFTELKAHDGRAHSLHYKSGFAVDGFIAALQKRIPQLCTTLDEPVHFCNYAFEVLESDITNMQKHAIAITYYTAPLLLHAVFGDHLLLSADDMNNPGNQVAATWLLTLQHHLSINSYTPVLKNTDCLI